MTGHGTSQQPRRKIAGVSVSWYAVIVLLLLTVFLITALIAPGFLVSDDSVSGSEANDGSSNSGAKPNGENRNRQDPADSFVREFLRNVNNGAKFRASDMACDGFLYARNTVAEAIAVDAHVAIEGKPPKNGGRGTIHDVAFSSRNGKQSSQLAVELGRGNQADGFCVYKFFFTAKPAATPTIDAAAGFASEVAKHIGNGAGAAVAGSFCPYQPPSDQGPAAEVVDSVVVRGGSGQPEITDIERTPGSSGNSMRRVDLESATGETIELGVKTSISGNPCIASLDL